MRKKADYILKRPAVYMQPHANELTE